jgi:hypothetical protein
MDEPVVDETRMDGQAADAGRIATARRRLVMLGAAAVVPSVVTLPSGATVAASSNGRCWALDPSEPPERFAQMPDGWLRKEVHSGECHGRFAVCTTWDQTSCTLESDRKATDGTQWVVDAQTVTAGPGTVVTHVSDRPNYYALIYVDETGSQYTLDPPLHGPTFKPVTETCWASMIGSNGNPPILG